MLRPIVLVWGIAWSTTALCASDQSMSQAANFEEFTAKFCAASRTAPHIFVVPVAVFEEQTVTCDDGDSTLRTAEPNDDPGHIVFNIDPPHGSKQSFDCDGKADVDMTPVAINCLPVAEETATHPKE